VSCDVRNQAYVLAVGRAIRRADPLSSGPGRLGLQAGLPDVT
jgi:hypothetical protein